jgi:hypothetical protein
MHTFPPQIKQSTTEWAPKDKAVLDAWSYAWASAGWATRVLTPDDAKKHPRFSELEARVAKLPVGENVEYFKMCYLRSVYCNQALSLVAHLS